jgi:hypothetical protein
VPAVLTASVSLYDNGRFVMSGPTSGCVGSFVPSGVSAVTRVVHAPARAALLCAPAAVTATTTSPADARSRGTSLALYPLCRAAR